ncbi:hypothetical protein BFW38_02605 [Terasakiispira papahanaumokuakeensis]|uniref:Chemotaxis protein n=1 Tax=Terasakiispira papahanaumokuakeensis TaxID=197479 RepID=A0A1E2V6R0_9GAMM|nr:methyl-accepting chemotaxis protein [Terasakiispira papahanaumokuakeensis]ODC02603.1 hypothetical protein BFW38_02605 [Terasakiispira papahanaumokuakeensis]
MLRKLNIGVRTTLSFSIILILMIITSLFALQQISNVRASAEEIEKNWMESIYQLGNVTEHMLTLRVHTVKVMGADSAEEVKGILSEGPQLVEDLQNSQKKYQALISSSEERNVYQSLEAELQEYLQARSQMIERRANGQPADPANENAINRTGDQMTDDLARLKDLNHQGAAKSSAKAGQQYENAKIAVALLIVASSLLTILLAILITRSLTQPIQAALMAAERIAQGDLTQEITVEGKDEPAQLLNAITHMQKALRQVIQQILETSSQLATASTQLQSATDESTRNLHQQSDEVEQAATAITEMTTAVEEVANNATSTSEASQESEKTAHHGRTEVQNTAREIKELVTNMSQTSTSMEDLAEKAQSISTVLDVIRKISEQTNLLALNAAIEAARAGEQGRGFAVVADEVRALAQRTQDSTTEIEQIISSIQNGTQDAVEAMRDSNSRVQKTLAAAEQAEEALQTIALAISGINERNLVIASASEEQAQVAREVDRSLVNIRDLSVQSAASANQTSSAIESLTQMAQGLKQQVSRFQI